MNELFTNMQTNPELFLKVLGMLGAMLAFAVALFQYGRGQLWHRKEFIGNEIKDFFGQPSVRNALLMIDWSARRIPFDPALDRNEWPKVTRSVQVQALEPHVLRLAQRDKETGHFRHFSPMEAEIRDTYDSFLDGLERLASFSEAGLFGPRELLPYLKYWIKDLTTSNRSSEDQRWLLALHAYIQFYKFLGAQRLLCELGRDVTVGGELWKELQLSDPDLAAALEGTCKSAN